jgi:hypothetical protein
VLYFITTFTVRLKEMKLDETFKFIVSNPKLDHFSAIELRTAYLIVDTECTLSASETRRFIYAELVKLVNRGWLNKVTSKKKGITSYVKTELFNFNPKVVFPSKSLNRIVPIKTVSAGSMQELNCRLQDYKNDLLEGLGEADEYRALRNEFPHMHDELQPKYNGIRESNSRLLGKIKAIETLIKDREES